MLSFNIILTTIYKPSYLLTAVVTANLSFESFVFDQATFAFLLEATLFLSKKRAISVNIFSQLAVILVVACHYTDIILCRPLLSDRSLMRIGHVGSNPGRHSVRETFDINSSLIHTVITYICSGYFTHRG